MRSILAIFGLAVLIVSCAYDNAEELYGLQDCREGGASFSQTVNPIIQTNCAIPGCHVNGGQPPALTTYEEISANGQLVKIRTSNGTMPPSTSGKSLTKEEIDAIACWVEAGTPNN